MSGFAGSLCPDFAVASNLESPMNGNPDSWLVLVALGSCSLLECSAFAGWKQSAEQACLLAVWQSVSYLAGVRKMFPNAGYDWID